MPHAPRPADPGPRTRRRGTIVGAIIGGALLIALAAGAVLVMQSGWPFDSRGGDGVTRERTVQPPAEPVKFLPDGSAEDNLPYFEQILREFGEGSEPVEGVPVVNAVTGAGFERSAMQVSFDRTQTNLVADNIFVAVRIGEDCLIGQVVTADRSVFASVEPAVGPDGSVCLIGNTRPIDWGPAA